MNFLLRRYNKQPLAPISRDLYRQFLFAFIRWHLTALILFIGAYLIANRFGITAVFLTMGLYAAAFVYIELKHKIVDKIRGRIWDIYPHSQPSHAVSAMTYLPITAIPLHYFLCLKTSTGSAEKCPWLLRAPYFAVGLALIPTLFCLYIKMRELPVEAEDLSQVSYWLATPITDALVSNQHFMGAIDEALRSANDLTRKKLNAREPSNSVITNQLMALELIVSRLEKQKSKNPQPPFFRYNPMAYFSLTLTDVLVATTIEHYYESHFIVLMDDLFKNVDDKFEMSSLDEVQAYLDLKARYRSLVAPSRQPASI